jgi:hypothetical protein
MFPHTAVGLAVICLSPGTGCSLVESAQELAKYSVGASRLVCVGRLIRARDPVPYTRAAFEVDTTGDGPSKPVHQKS